MKIVVIILLALLLQNCNRENSIQKEFNSIRSKVYEKSYYQTWEIINNWSKLKNADIKFIDKSEGLINLNINVPDSLLFKYTDFTKTYSNSEFYDVTCNVYIFLKPIDNRTQVDIKTTFTGKIENPKIFFKGQYIETDSIKHQSTGMLEKEILDYILNN